MIEKRLVFQGNREADKKHSQAILGDREKNEKRRTGKIAGWFRGKMPRHSLSKREDTIKMSENATFFEKK